jgi:hypothetical protein
MSTGEGEPHDSPAEGVGSANVVDLEQVMLEQLQAVREGRRDPTLPVLLQHSIIDAQFPMELLSLPPAVGTGPPHEGILLRAAAHIRAQVSAEDYPNFRKAIGVVAVVEPGDMLFIPPYWWHWVFSSEEAVGCNLFFSPPPQAVHPHSSLPSEEVEFYRKKNKSRDGSLTLPVTVCDQTVDIAAQFMASLNTSQPFLIQQRCNHWGLQRYCLADILKADSGRLSRFVVSDSGGHSLCPMDRPKPAYADSGRNIKGTAADCQQYLTEHPDSTLQFTLSLGPDCKELIEGIRIPPFVPAKALQSINLWCNRGPLHTGLHYDAPGNILAGIRGRKFVLMFPQSERPHLYHEPFLPSQIKSMQYA